MTGYVGKETKLKCNLLGKPTPEIEWTRSPPAPISNGRYDLKEDGLVINSTEIGDTGVYICTAKNKYGSIFQATHLEVKPVGKNKISGRLLFTSRKLFSLSRHTRVVISHVKRDFHQQDKKNWNFSTSMRLRSPQQPRANLGKNKRKKCIPKTLLLLRLNIPLHLCIVLLLLLPHVTFKRKESPYSNFPKETPTNTLIFLQNPLFLLRPHQCRSQYRLSEKRFDLTVLLKDHLYRRSRGTRIASS